MAVLRMAASPDFISRGRKYQAVSDFFGTVDAGLLDFPIKRKIGKVRDGGIYIDPDDVEYQDAWAYALRDYGNPGEREARFRYKNDWRSMNPGFAREIIDALPGDVTFHVLSMPSSKANQDSAALLDLQREIIRQGGTKKFFPFEREIDKATGYATIPPSRRFDSPSRGTVKYVRDGMEHEYSALLSGDRQGDMARIMKFFTGYENRAPLEEYRTLSETHIERPNGGVLLLDDYLGTGGSVLGMREVFNDDNRINAGDGNYIVPLSLWGRRERDGDAQNSRRNIWESWAGDQTMVEAALVAAHMEPMRETNPSLFYTRGLERHSADFRNALMDDTTERFDAAADRINDILSRRKAVIPRQLGGGSYDFTAGDVSFLQEGASNLRDLKSQNLLPVLANRSKEFDLAYVK